MGGYICSKGGWNEVKKEEKKEDMVITDSGESVRMNKKSRIESKKRVNVPVV